MRPTLMFLLKCGNCRDYALLRLKVFQSTMFGTQGASCVSSMIHNRMPVQFAVLAKFSERLEERPGCFLG